MNDESYPSDEDSTHNDLLRAHSWILLLESDTATPEDRLSFEDWLAEDPRHLQLYDQALTFRDALQQIRITDLDADIAKRSGSEQLSGFLDGLRLELSLVRLATGAALMSAIALVAFWLPSADRTQDTVPAVAQTAPRASNHATAVAEVRTIRLTDQSVVTMGADSSLSVVYSGSQRVVRLSAGEAHFEVAPETSRPFTVKVDSVSVVAIGTAFDVRRIREGYKVAVSEGVVQVSAPHVADGQDSTLVQRQRLTAGEQVEITRNGRIRAPKRIAVDVVGAWRRHQLIYQGDRLSDLLSDANRYSDIPIEVAPGSEVILDLQVRGVFLGTDVRRLLDTLGRILPVQVDYSEDGKILVKKKN